MHFAPLFLTLSLLTFGVTAGASDLKIVKELEKSEVSPPSMCFLFNDLMQGSPSEFNLNGFIDLLEENTPITPLASLNDAQLCLNSLKHGKSYTVVLKKGLSSKHNNKLATDLKRQFTLSKAPASLNIDKGNLLTLDDLNIGINSINLNKINLQLFKLSNTDLNALNLSSLINENLTPYILKNLLDEHAVKIAQKSINVREVTDVYTKSIFNLNELLHEKDKSGIYLLIAGQSDFDINNEADLFDDDKLFQSKLIFVSDLGLSAFWGKNGLYVSVKSLNLAKAQNNVELNLIANNNSILCTEFTDEDGFAFIDSHYLNGNKALAPIALIAKKDKDVFALDLRQQPLFLEGNEGLAPSDSPYLTYAFTDRGVYRPGEKIHFNALVRTPDLKAAFDKKFLLKVINPNGVEVVKANLTDKAVGLYSFDYELPSASLRGQWSLRLFSGSKRISETLINVSDFVASQINAQFLPTQTLPEKINTVTFKTDFNYGAPASSLKYYPQIALEVNTQPFDNFKDFHFSVDDSDTYKYTEHLNVGENETDALGQGTFDIKSTRNDVPQKAKVKVNIIDLNGQEIQIGQDVNLLYPYPLIGIKEIENKDESDKSLAFILVDNNGLKTAGNASYTLYKENIDYQYIYNDYRWQFKQIVSKVPLISGVLNFTTGQELTEKWNLPDGSYLIEAKTADSITTMRFNKGYSSYYAPETPERFVLSSDKRIYQINDTITLSFESPFAGNGVLALGSNSIKSLQNLEIKKGYNEISLKAPKDLYPGTHALLTLYSSDKNQNIRRAIGLTYLKFDDSVSRIVIKDLNHNLVVKPNSVLEVPLNFENLTKPTFVKAFLVDEGVLSLTDFKGIEPEDLLKPRRLSYNIYDIYGNAFKKVSTNNQGYGDDIEFAAGKLNSLSAFPHKVIALDSKLIKVENNNTKLSFNVPQFSGSLKLMVFAFNKDQIGSLNKSYTVKDKAVINLSLPRYLRLTDTLRANLNLNNLESKDHDFKIKIDCSGSVTCNFADTLNVKQGISTNQKIDISATKIGTGTINIEVNNQDYSYKDAFAISVLSNYPNTLDKVSTFVKPKEQVTLKLNHHFKEDAQSYLCESSLPLVNAKTFIKDLNSDGYLNLEERALRVLVNLSQSVSEQNPTKLQEESQVLLAHMDNNGSFYDFYNLENTDYNSVLTSIALLRLHDNGFYIEDNIVKNLNRNLLNQARIGDPATKALAYSELALRKNINVAAVRYFFDEGNFEDLLAYCHLIRSFTLLNDADRLQESIDKAFKLLDKLNTLEIKLSHAKEKTERENLIRQIQDIDTQSLGKIYLSYSLIAALGQAGFDKEISKVVDKADLLSLNNYYLNQSDKAIMLLALYSLNVTLDKDTKCSLIKDSNLKKIHYQNKHDNGVFITASAFGQTQSRPQNIANGISINKKYFNTHGKELKAPFELKTNDLLIVTLTLENHDVLFGQNINVRDLLPAGFEFVRKITAYDNQFAFLDVSNEAYIKQQLSDSEILLNIYSDFPKVTYAYILRAAVPGTYTIPDTTAFSIKNANVRAHFGVDDKLTVTP